MNNPNTTKLDPDVSALVISQALVLRRVIETATNVRNLMYEFLINDKVVTKVTPVMFHKAINKLSETPSFNYGDFDRALNAAGTIPNKIITMYKEIICDEIEISIDGMSYWGDDHALANCFSTAFPDAANSITNPSSDAPRSTKLKHLSKLSNLFHIMLDKYVDIRSPSKKTRKLFDKASTLNARRAADDAWNAARDAYPMCAASSAVMIVDTHPDLQDFIRHTAPQLLEYITNSVLSKGGTTELAMSIKAFLLDGLLSYPDDDDAASQEVAVRAIRLANQWTASCAAIAVFRTLMGITGAAAWTMADDKERFESTYGSVLDMASKLDTGVFYAFFTFKQFTWDEMPRHELFGKAWESICERSGRTMDQWVSMAKKLDYKAIASAPENAAIIAIYCNGYDDFLKSAAEETSGL